MASNLAFQKGDRVAVNHEFGVHGARSVMRSDAVPAGTKLGTVKGAANEAGTWFTVELDKGGEKVLTQDELVKVEE